MKRLFLIAILLLAFAFPASASNICGSSSCQSSEVGPFMAGISQNCGNWGTCTLADIMQVFHNIGNWILGIVGSVVLAMYVYGGFMYMLGGANEDFLKRGKQALRISTIGLLIVFFAYAGITTLNNILRRGSIDATEDVDEYVACAPNGLTEGQPCDLNSTCTEDGQCMSQCLQNHGNGETIYINEDTEWYQYLCGDINDPPTVPGFSEVTSSEVNLCPGGDNIQCLLIHGNYNGGL